MYLPPHFDSKDRAIAAQLMREHPFASLISVDDEGLPFVTHLPLVLDDRGEEGGFALLGHCARPNPAWRHLQARPRAVVTFLGPHAYLSPSVYPDLARVPTWNYLAVHCTVEARLIESPAEKDALLKRLIGEHEPAYAQQWRDLGEEFQSKMLNGIMGFELRVTALQCKLKLNQHRREAHAAMHAQYSAGSPDEQALAGWMRRLGMKTEAASAEEG
jgi:transcriptional regulator